MPNKFVKYTRRWILPLFVIATAIILQSIDNIDKELFRYDRADVLNGEYWRFLTAHFIHLGWSHFFLNMLVFIGFWVMFNSAFRQQQWFIIVLLCSIGISICFFLFDPDLDWYVGFSGVLHGIFAAAALASLIHYWTSTDLNFPWEGSFILIGIIAKITYEQIMGAVPMTQKASGGNVIVNAHLYGTLLGGFFSLCFTRRR